MLSTELAHVTSSLCDATAEHAFSYLSDASRLGEWALGCWEAVEEAGGLVRGVSLFDGAQTFARADPDAGRMTVDWDVGDDSDNLVRRIAARVVPGSQIGKPGSKCLVLLTAWRIASMDDRRWHQLVVAHEAEMLLLRHRIETWAPTG